jgi:hypothetical protein
VLSALALAACGDGSTTPAPTAVALELRSAPLDSVTVARRAAHPFVVRAIDRAGRPVPGVLVYWTIDAGGGAAPTTPITDANGESTAWWTPGTEAGDGRVIASLDGARATFAVRVVPDVPAHIATIGGMEQAAAPGSELAAPFVIDVRDRHGNLVPRAAVHWRIDGPDAGDHFMDAAPATDMRGRALARVRLGEAPGDRLITVSVAGAGEAHFEIVAERTRATRVPRP